MHSLPMPTPDRFAEAVQYAQKNKRHVTDLISILGYIANNREIKKQLQRSLGDLGRSAHVKPVFDYDFNDDVLDTVAAFDKYYTPGEFEKILDTIADFFVSTTQVMSDDCVGDLENMQIDYQMIASLAAYGVKVGIEFENGTEPDGEEAVIININVVLDFGDFEMRVG